MMPILLGYLVVSSSERGQAPGVPFEEIRIEAGDAGILEVTDSFFFNSLFEMSFTIAKRMEGRIQRTGRAVMATRSPPRPWSCSRHSA